MNISYSNSTGGANGPFSDSRAQQIRADMQAIDKALQTGDLTSAQTAYQQLQTDAPWLAKDAGTQSNSANSPGTTFAALGTALQSGDLSGAQKAFAQLRLSAGHHRHHANDQASGGSDDPSGNQGLRTLATALQSGDMTTALSAFNNLQPSLLSALDGTDTTPTGGNSPLQNLASALQANDPQQAQGAFLSLLDTQRQQGAYSLYGADGTSGLAGGGTGGYLVDDSA